MFFNKTKRESLSKLKEAKKEYRSLYHILEEESSNLVYIRKCAILKIKEVEKYMDTVIEFTFEFKEEIYNIFNYINKSNISLITETRYNIYKPPYDPSLKQFIFEFPSVPKIQMPWYYECIIYLYSVFFTPISDKIEQINTTYKNYQESIQKIKRCISKIKNIINETNIISCSILVDEFYNFPKNYNIWNDKQKNKLILIINYIKILNKLIKEKI